MNTMWLVGAFSDKDKACKKACEKACKKASGTAGDTRVLVATGAKTEHLPFAALVISTTDDLEALKNAADVGTYLVTERTIRNRPIRELSTDNEPGVLGIFTMVANPDMGAKASDQHWRDNHAPLALEIHEAMTHYYQLSVQHVFSGPDWNGFALCCFATEDDLRHKFFNSPEGERRIAEDVAIFADTRNSPRRVISSLYRST